MHKAARELPLAREDSLCVDCVKKTAVAYGRFCTSCMRKRINDDNPIPQVLSDKRGRKSRSTQMLGGSAEMGTDGDNW